LSQHCSLSTSLPPPPSLGLSGRGTSSFRQQHHRNCTNQQERYWGITEVATSPPAGTNVICSLHSGHI
jgi:hypothetical protein